MNDIPPTLYTFSVSHYSEKIRWTLDHAGIAYREQRLVPFFHIPRILALTRRATSVPVLEAGAEVVQDSTRILEWLERQHAPFTLLPADPALRAEVMELEARFDRIGVHVIRQLFAETMRDKAATLALWSQDANPLQRRALSLAYPLVRRGFSRLLQLSPGTMRKAVARIDEAADFIAERTQGGRPYLAGDRLSAADITACALLSPLVCPEEHPVFGAPAYRRTVRMRAVRWDDHPGFEWVRGVYREHRGVRRA
ncbi:glutathione S-transferase [Solimonas sp. K1W22B-7]|uniref:glutathione S-transferase family protein n=1 Tax=Solimonas sp. K1W22B-7 TaxID=2303331 RepID=UPI000E33526B|nr:glutathione S-transferase [Solimonas sp. K1W22B-7]AXQ30880.1 glutathione S-transferase [Solimonas sp. K1W22B-7]